jgi:hypothetical protein
LGNGRTGEHIASKGKIQFDVHYEPGQLSLSSSLANLMVLLGLVRGIESHKIVGIACGNAHSLLIDDKGYAQILVRKIF